MLDHDLAAVARRQHGVVTTHDLRRLGVTAHEVRTRLESGAWLRLNDSAVAVAGAPATWGRAVTAALAAMPGTVLSHACAARAHRFRGFERCGEIVLLGDLGEYHRLRGATVRRTRLLPDSHVTTVDGLPVTTIARTLIDLGADVLDGRLQRLVEDQLSARRVTWTELDDAFSVLAARGRPGIGRIRRVLGAIEGSPPTESELERRFLRVLQRHGIDAPAMQVREPWSERELGRVDGMHADRRIIVELDGRTFHARTDAFERDRRRDQLALVEGFRTVRFTYRQVLDEPGHVADVVRRLVHG